MRCCRCNSFYGYQYCPHGGMADETDLKSVVFRGVPVQVWLRAPNYRHSVMVARQPPNLFVRVQVLVPVPFFSCKLSLNLILLIIKLNAFVAQLDRAIGFYPSGCGFDSCQRRQFLVDDGLTRYVTSVNEDC